jgi:nitrogen-specific signal transduction histidine kinase
MKNFPADVNVSRLDDNNFCTGISHDVRNSMNAIMGFAQILHEHSVSDSETREYAQIIFKESKFLLEYFDRMMKMFQSMTSEYQKPQFESFK